MFDEEGHNFTNLPKTLEMGMALNLHPTVQALGTLVQNAVAEIRV